MNKSTIKVGSFIQLPQNSFKPTKRSSKQILKSQKIQNQSIQNNQINSTRFAVEHSNVESCSVSSVNKINHNTSRNDLKSGDEVPEKQLNNFVDKLKSAFTKNLFELKYKRQIINEEIEKEICSTVPPFEWFIQDKIDPDLRKKKLFNYLKEDDYLIGIFVTDLTKSKSDTKKACFKLICFDGCKRRLIHDLALYCYYLIDEDCSFNSELCPQNEGKYFRFKVQTVIREQIFVTFNHSSTIHDNLHLKLGPINFDEMPEHFKKVIYLTQQAWNKPQNYETISTFDNLLQSNKQYQNPFSVDYMLDTLQINDENFFKQSDQVTDDNLRAGIECLKREQYEKAELLLEKVIDSEPGNVDAHVGLGCVFANQSKYKKAIRKFEDSLKLNDKHPNAKKYLIDVLMENGRNLYKQKDYSSALNVYKQILYYDSTNQMAIEQRKSIETRLTDSKERDRKKSKKTKRSPKDSYKRRHH